MATPEQMLDGELFANQLYSLEKNFGLPSKFLVHLVDEDDWTFIIKAHSFLEAAITEAVIIETGNDRLDNLLGSMPLLGRHSKVAFAEDLGIINPPDKTFVKRLSIIRNFCVHRLEAASFNLTGYVASLEPNERANTLNELLFLPIERDLVRKFFETIPRKAIWLHAIAVVTRLEGRKARTRFNAGLRDHYLKVASGVLGPLRGLE